MVGHERPDCTHFSDPRVQFVTATFPPPLAKDYNLYTLDKSEKLRIGLHLARSHEPTFVMAMDADDLISSNLTQFALQRPKANGWIIKRGYRYAFGSSWIFRTNSFNCGTNAIVNARHVVFPEGRHSRMDHENCVVLRSGHVGIESEMARQGNPLEPLPFRGGVYISDHGDNITDIGPWGGREPRRLRWVLRSLKSIQLLTSRVVQEFNISPLLNKRN